MRIRHRLSAAVLAAALVGIAAPLRAQEAGSRAEELARQQAEKAGHVAPYQAPWIEREILSIENAGGFGAARGFFVTFGDIKTGSSLALGPAYGKTFASGAIFQAKAAYSIRNFKMAQVAIHSAPFAGGRLVARGRARWQDAPELVFHGLGPDPAKPRIHYAETKSEVSGEATFRPIRFLRFDAGTGFEKYSTGAAHNTAQSDVDAFFGGVPGFSADPGYAHSFVSAAIDSRTGEGYSRSGTLLRATAHDYRHVDDPLQDAGFYTFRRIDATAEQFVPILHGNWVIYLGLRASTTTASADHQVPFFLMPTLGGSDLRGYGNYRFRDRHSLLFTAEYRWYAQEFVDAAIFYDAGKTVPRRGDLDFDGLKSSIGAGIRLHGLQTTALRIEVARGREGLRLILAFSPIGG